MIAIVHTGTKLELLNEIEVGDDIWYQVNYTGAIEQSMEEPSTDNEEAFADSEQTADEQNEPEQTEETEALTENAEPEATAEEMEDTAEADAASAEEPVAEASENETEAEQQGIIAYVKSDMTDIAQQEQKSETEQTTLTYDGMDYTVTVSFDEKAGIPENAELVVKEIEQGTEEYENYYRQSLTAMVENSVALNNEEELSVSFARFFDISFLADGEKIEPDASVNVKISYHDAVSFTEDDEVNAVHFADEGTEVLEASAEGENSMEAVSFSQDSFSVTGTLVADMRKSALTYADDELIVKVEEVDQGAIPQGAILKVQPLESGDEDTAQQYKEVGEQLQEKAEEEEYDIAGYLAYDISLVDKDGNEIEPEGQVKVSMDYKEAKIPAEISEDAEVMEPEGAETEAITEETEDTTESELAEDAEPVSVVESTISLQGQMELTVMHLEEDENGGITVVDLSEKEQISELEATEKNEIKGTEFVTDSFSDYTVTWQRWNSNVGIKSYYGKIDNQGRFIPYATSSYALQKIPSQYSDNTYQETNEEIDLANYTNADLFGTCRHIYVSGYIDLSGISNFSQQAMESNVLRLDWEETDRQWKVKYQNSQGNFEVLRRDASGQTIYVFYDCSTEPLEEITTIDNDAFGIKMSMTDYEDHSDDNISDWHEKFLYQRYNGRNYQLGGNYMDANGGMTPGLVKNKLEQGYPVTSNDKPKQEHNLSLRPLFDSRTSANHLLKFDDQGYFVYNSFENYAYYNQTDGNFKVYKQIGTPYARNDNHVTDGDNGNIRLFQRGNFLPYNDIEPGRFASGMTRQRGELDQVLGPATDSRYDEQLYLPNGSINYQFGMYMEVNFVQPENGNKSNGDPMIFEFTGDDDLWVFIDDVLVLDIGGVHEARKGRIDFNTGAVTIENATKNLESDDAVRNTNIKQRFQEAGVSDVLYRENSNTFADYTQHTLKMFYMERGQSASDLHIKFNLQTIPSSTITVSKELAGTDKAEYANETFKYKLEVYMPYNETSTFYSWWWVTPDITNIWSRLNGITITDSVTGAPISFDKYGYFSLRPGQTAILSGEGLTVNLKYRITEIGVDTTKYDEVVATGTTETTTTLNPSEPPKDALSEEETVGNMPKVTFANHVRNPSMLQIKKQMEAGAQVPENDTFNFKIELNDQSGTLVPYRNGKYYLKNANDEYVWIATDGSTCTSSSLKDAQHYGTTDASGQVSGIKAGETIVITGLIAGTNFKVTETDLDSAKYYTPKITVTGCGAPNPATETESDTGTGTIQANTDAMVTVTNRP
ncbi:MAG: fibro-slime domain-containing protein, partial [Eubacteriales bacterium]|nr:fibro-slime domain-containing protein [Eubacteriales bacterium]